MRPCGAFGRVRCLVVAGFTVAAPCGCATGGPSESAGCEPAPGRYVVHYVAAQDGGGCSTIPDETVEFSSETRPGPMASGPGTSTSDAGLGCTASSSGCTFRFACTEIEGATEGTDDGDAGDEPDAGQSMVVTSGSITYTPSGAFGTTSTVVVLGGRETRCDYALTVARR
jgi:hypothetical protein